MVQSEVPDERVLQQFDAARRPVHCRRGSATGRAVYVAVLYRCRSGGGLYHNRELVGEVPDESHDYRTRYGLSQSAGDLSDGQRVPGGAVECESNGSAGDGFGVSVVDFGLDLFEVI